MRTTPWTKATHANIEANQGPRFGGSYRVTIFAGKTQTATSRFDMVDHGFQSWSDNFGTACDSAYAAAKKYAAGFGVS